MARKTIQKKKIIVILSIVTILSALAALLILHFSPANNGDRQQIAKGLPCSKESQSSLLPSAIKALDLTKPAKISQLGKVVSKIESRKNYKKDSNCLYAVVWYYILVADIEKAQDNLQLLEKLGKGKELNFNDFKQPVSISDLKKETESLIFLEKEADNNTIFIQDNPDRD